MKKFTVTLAAGLLICLSGFAGDETQNKKDNRALQVTRQMASELRLNERTFIQVKDLNVNKYQELDKVNAMFANDAKQREAKTREVETRYNEQISALLSPSQKASFAAFLSNSDNGNMANIK